MQGRGLDVKGRLIHIKPSRRPPPNRVFPAGGKDRAKGRHLGRMTSENELPSTTAPRHPEKVGKPDNPIQRKPAWIRVKAPVSAEYHATRTLMRDLGLHTVCEEAACPNIGEFWAKKHATGM